MTKHVARKEGSSRHSAIHWYEWLRLAKAIGMDRAGNEIFACAARPHDQHTRLMGGHDFYIATNLL